MYAWMITKDHITREGSNAAGLVGPSGTTIEAIKALNAISVIAIEELPLNCEAFRMYDDDNTLYYEGLIIGDRDTDGFEPLDDYGEPGAGCTRIDYWSQTDKRWEIL